jgi:hypothetical protein
LEERPKLAARVLFRQKRDSRLQVDFDYAQEGAKVVLKNLSRCPDSKIVASGWEFGDGTSSDETEPAHAFPSPGLYAVTLRCRTEAGHEDICQRTVQFRAFPDLDGLKPAEPVRITRAASWEGEPSFSPDGARIAFVSDRGGSSEVYTMGSDGSDTKLVSRWAETPALPSNRGYPYRCLSPAWSPDGRWIAFSSNRESPSYDIWVVSADGGLPRRFTPQLVTTDEHSPRWSPDGAWIAFASDAGELQNVWVKPVGGGAPRRLTAHREAGFPAWHPSGERVGFLSPKETSPTYACLWQVELRSVADEALTRADAGKSGPFSWSPCGATIAYARQIGGGYGDLQSSALFLLDVRTGKTRQLTSLEHHCDSPAWSPDGSAIVFRRMERKTGNSDLWLMRLVTETWQPRQSQPAIEVVVDTEDEVERAFREAGDLSQNRRQHREAVERFLDVAKRYAEHPLAPEALGRAALAAALGARDFELGAAICRDLVRQYPHHPQAQQAMFLEGLCYQSLLLHEKLVTVKLGGHNVPPRPVPKEYALRCIDVLKRQGYSVVDSEPAAPAPAPADWQPGGPLAIGLDQDFFCPSDQQVVARVRVGPAGAGSAKGPLQVSLVRRSSGDALESVRIAPPIPPDLAVPFRIGSLPTGRWDTKGYAVEARLGDLRAETPFGMLKSPLNGRTAVRSVEVKSGLLVDGRPLLLIGTNDWEDAARYGCNAALAMPMGSALDPLWAAGLYAIATAPAFNPDDWSMFNGPTAARQGTEPRLEAYRLAARACSAHPALIGWIILDEPAGKLAFSAFDQVSEGFRFFAEAENILARHASRHLVGAALGRNWLDELRLFAPLTDFLLVDREELRRLPGTLGRQCLVCARIAAKPPLRFAEAASRTKDLDYGRWAAWSSILSGARSLWFEKVDRTTRRLAAELQFFAPALPALQLLEAKPGESCLAGLLPLDGTNYLVVYRKDERETSVEAEVALPVAASKGKDLASGREFVITGRLLKADLPPFSVLVVELTP